MSSEIAVVGLGYVGLPLALAFDKTADHVVGYDIDADRISQLQAGRDPTGEVGESSIRESGVTFTSHPAALRSADYHIVTVPTPINDTGVPDLDMVESAGKTVGQHLSDGSTVILESTVYPGATRHVFIPALEEKSGLEAGTDFAVGYSPERVVPGSDTRNLQNVVKIVSAFSESSLEIVASLYEPIIDAGVHRASSIEVAETAKCVENMQRDLNIALVNELAMACNALGLDSEAVLEAAGTKWNFHEYRPGLVGGHCIPVDPFFFIYQSEQNGFTPELIKQAREVNEYVPKHVAEMTLKALNDNGNVLSQSRVLVLGLAYKANTEDIRTSAVDGVIDELEEYDIEVFGYDPVADTDAIHEEFGISTLTTPTIEDFDALVIGAAHDEFLEMDLARACSDMTQSPVVVDTTGKLDQLDTVPNTDYRRL